MVFCLTVELFHLVQVFGEIGAHMAHVPSIRVRQRGSHNESTRLSTTNRDSSLYDQIGTPIRPHKYLRPISIDQRSSCVTRPKLRACLLMLKFTAKITTKNHGENTGKTQVNSINIWKEGKQNKMGVYLSTTRPGLQPGLQPGTGKNRMAIQ